MFHLFNPKPKVVQPPEKQSSTPTIEPGAVFFLKKNGFYIKIVVVKTTIQRGNNPQDFAFKININDNKTESTKYVFKKDYNNIVETFASGYDPANLSLHDSIIFINDNEIFRNPNILSDPKLIPYLNGFTISKERPAETYVQNIQTDIYKEHQEEEVKGGKANTTRKFRVSKASNIRRKNKLSKHRKLHRKKTKKLNRRI